MNLFAFAGNLTRDPEMRTTQSGKKVASLTVALNNGRHTVFMDCIAWEKAAEILCEFCKKGERLSGSGSLITRSWEKDGIKRYKTEVVISQFDLPPRAKGQEIPEYNENQVSEDEIPF